MFGKKVPVFMYAATITKPQGGQSCNIFWPFEEDEDEEEGASTITESPISNSPKPHVLNGQTAFTFYSFFLGFAIPLFLILIFYVQVVWLYIQSSIITFQSDEEFVCDSQNKNKWTYPYMYEKYVFTIFDTKTCLFQANPQFFNGHDNSIW